MPLSIASLSPSWLISKVSVRSRIAAIAVIPVVGFLANGLAFTSGETQGGHAFVGVDADQADHLGREIEEDALAELDEVHPFQTVRTGTKGAELRSTSKLPFEMRLIIDFSGTMNVTWDDHTTGFPGSGRFVGM